MQNVQRHGDHIHVIIRLRKCLADLDHIARSGICHVAQRQSTLFINNSQHRINIRIVQHQKAFGILHGMAVLLQDRNTEAMKCIDITGIVVPCQVMNPLPHLIGGFIGKCNAQNVPGQNSDLIDQIGKTP